MIRPNRRGEVRDPMAYVGLAIAVVLVVGGMILFYLYLGEELESRYGTASGQFGHVSVNGVGILGGMFKEAGHRVSSWPRLSPALRERADTIVWFPSDLAKPSDEASEWLDDWLLEESGRTLIYVGRDFDAEAGYWKQVSPGAPTSLASEFATRQAKAEGNFTITRQPLAPSEDWHWFTIEGTLKHRDVRTLAGSPRWVAGVDPSKVEIELNGRLIPPKGRFQTGEFQDMDEVLLESEGDALVWSEKYLSRSRNPDEHSQLIVVANGSFLLNLQLVNHEHRKLAAALVREIGPKQHVVFLEAGGSPEVSDKDPQVRFPTAAQMLGIAPFNRILLHLALVGIIFCFSRWPIFGRPREEPPAPLSDFGEHVSSLGELLALAGNRELALARLQQYQQKQRPDARGQKPPAPTAPPGNA
jgi:hypothetical protein